MIAPSSSLHDPEQSLWLRRSHRERSRLVRERTAHINRIKGLLFAQGIRDINVKSRYKTLAVDEFVTGDGHRLPPRLAGEITQEIHRLAMVQEQIAEIERERDAAPTTCEATERKRDLLSQLKSVGPTISAFLSREVYYRILQKIKEFVSLAKAFSAQSNEP